MSQAHPRGNEEYERACQLAAEQAGMAGAAEEPAIAQYRLVYRAVREAPMPPVPADLAAALARAVRHQAQQADSPWSIVLAVPLLLGLLAVALASQWHALASALAPALASGPWGALGAAGLAVVLFRLVEHASSSGSSRPKPPAAPA